jgi:outer membrane protein assembly factor BamB
VQQATLAAAGPAFVAVLGEQVDGKRFYALVHADGTITDREQGQYDGGLRCRYDGVSVTVCAIGVSNPLFALDATTGKDLWQLPATGRIAPNVTAVWDGAVYGTAGGKPLVLDAHTGTDKETSPGLAPSPSADTPASQPAHSQATRCRRTPPSAEPQRPRPLVWSCPATRTSPWDAVKAAGRLPEG